MPIGILYEMSAVMSSVTHLMMEDFFTLRAVSLNNFIILVEHFFFVAGHQLSASSIFTKSLLCCINGICENPTSTAGVEELPHNCEGQYH